MADSGGANAQTPLPAEVPPQGRTSAAEWAAAVKQLRDVAQWLIGGVIATSAGVVAGASLSKIGQLDPVEDAQRFAVVVAGLALGFFAIARVFVAGLQVIAPSGGSLRMIARARQGELLAEARAELYRLYEMSEASHPLQNLLDDPQVPSREKYLERFKMTAPFAIVRARFSRLTRTLRWAVPAAVLGFGLFAWGANPRDKPAQKPAFELKIYR